MPQEYQTVFQIGLKTFPWAHALHPGILVAIGFALFRYSKQNIFRIFGFAGFAFGLIFLVISCLTIIPTFANARHAFVNGQSSVIEGPIANFLPKPALGEAKESFTVLGVSFSYNVLDSNGCFHDDPAIIRAGLDVRIYYHAACIQRVDLIKPVGQPASSP
jgi:hypothetical protein